MTKKDFIMIAAIISDIQDSTIRTFVACKFAEKLKLVNSRFDHDRFMKACGV